MFPSPIITLLEPKKLRDFGAKIGDRTRDLILTMDVLYQLSYLGDSEIVL